jgi:hypothetical protein
LNANKKSCEVCLRGKQSRLPFVARKPKRSKTALEIIHSYICGPFEVPNIGGRRYFITFVDEHTRMYSIVVNT